MQTSSLVLAVLSRPYVKRMERESNNSILNYASLKNRSKHLFIVIPVYFYGRRSLHTSFCAPYITLRLSSRKNTHRTTDYQQYKQIHHYLTHNNNSSNQKDKRTKEHYDYINMTKIQPELIICPKCSVVIATNPSNICLLFFLSIPTFSLIRKIMIYALLFITYSG